MRMIADKIEALLADKGYDADAIREELADAEIEAVIPAKRNRKDPAQHNAEKYKWRNLIERLFNKLKNWRRVATRYDKSKESYLGFVSSPSPQSSCRYPLSTRPSRPDARWPCSNAKSRPSRENVQSVRRYDLALMLFHHHLREGGNDGWGDLSDPGKAQSSRVKA